MGNANSNAAKKTTPENNQESNQITMQVVTKDQAPVVESPLTLEQKIQRVQDLSLLIDKLSQLNEAKRNLQTFKLSSDGLSIQLMLRDTTSNREFRTFNSAVVARIIQVIHETLQDKINEVESEIRF
jgi:hypothetical protein